MLEGTRIIQIYMKAEGPADPRFGDEIDDDAANDYAYDGWLPLALSPADEDGRRHATIIGDPWLTTPPGAEAPPEPGPAPVRITAAECSAELRERARLGLRYFTEETPDELGRPYDRDRIAEDLSPSLRNALTALDTDRPTRVALGDPEVRHVKITIAELSRVRETRAGADPPELEDACHDVVSDFIEAHHRQLVDYIEDRTRKARARLRDLLRAALRLGAFDD